MNASIAELLKLRLQSFSYVEKLAGMVRPVTHERAGGKVTIPVASNVEDVLQCGDSTLLDMVPDERYRAIVYFEDMGLAQVKSRTRGISWTSRLRLVCWLNTAKLGGGSTAGDQVAQQFMHALSSHLYNSGPFIGVRHRITGMPTKGSSLFSQYAYPDSVRQYLMWPFDAFGIDIETEFRIKPGCEPEVNTTDGSCWTPDASLRRRHPREFSCEELLDATNGLTPAQITCVAPGGGGACVGVEIRDSEGNLVATIADGGTYTLLPMFIRFANEAAALADNTTVPTLQQEVLIVDTLRRYPGNASSTVMALVQAEQFNPGFTQTNDGLLTRHDSTDYLLQLNNQ